jgi:hypothetical protein
MTMQWLKRLWRRPESTAEESNDALPIAAVPMVWRDEATLPIPDWHAMRADAPRAEGPVAMEAHYTAAAHAWLHALAESLDGEFSVARSQNFLLLSALGARTAKLTIDHCERTRRRILAALPDVARSTGYGPHVVLVFADQDQYYDYVGNYYPDDGEFAMSGGMFLQHGYGHFVFVAKDLGMMEPVITHELTHCLVMHLPLPAWLNEGIAVNTEKRLNPGFHRPGQGLYSEKELARQHAAFWNVRTIQEFWSGKSFLLPDDGNRLSYDLGTRLAGLAATRWEAFSAFANGARRDDAGAAAAQDHLGVSLHDMAAAVLGPGPWIPLPECWAEGTEAGQFRESDLSGGFDL